MDTAATPTSTLASIAMSEAETDRNSKILKTIADLEQASHCHLDWVSEVSKIIACRLKVAEELICDESHTRCKFGQWLHRGNHPVIKELKLYDELVERHRQFHGTAAKVLKQYRQQNYVEPHHYDHFTSQVSSFGAYLRNLQAAVWKQLSNHDPLTNLRNRQGMESELQAFLDHHQQHDYPGVIVMLDLDHFKQINDNYGHQIGDRVLREASNLVINELRPTDLAYRYGGEEFLLFLPNVSGSQGVLIAERLRENIEVHPFSVGEEQPISVTASLGLAQIQSDEHLRVTIAKADKALYQAKGEGRNRVCVEVDLLEQADLLCPLA